MSAYLGSVDRAAQQAHDLRLRASVFADLRGLEWPAMPTLIEAAPIDIPEECWDVVVADPDRLFHSFTQTPLQAGSTADCPEEFTFAEFTRQFIEPYILHEVGQQIKAAETQMRYWNDESQRIFQQEIVDAAANWMRGQQRCFKQLVANQQAINNRVHALERAVKEGHQIDAQNDVIMTVAPPMPKEPRLHFAELLTQILQDPEYQGMLTEAGVVLASGQSQRALSAEPSLHPFVEQVAVALSLTMTRKSSTRTPSPAMGSKPSGVGKQRKTSPATGSNPPKSRAPKANPTVQVIPPPIPGSDDAPSPITPKPTWAPPPPTPAAPVKPTGVGLFGSTGGALFPPPRSVEVYPAFTPERPHTSGGFAGFRQATPRTGPCERQCRIDQLSPEGRLRYQHHFPCTRRRDEPVVRPDHSSEAPAAQPPAPPPQPRPPKCRFCRRRGHVGPPRDPDSCEAFVEYLLGLGMGTANDTPSTPIPPPPPENPEQPPGGNTQAGDQGGDEESFDGYNRPGETHSRNTGGSGGGNAPPPGGNVGAGGNPGDSSSSDSSDDDADSLPDLTPFLGRRKPNWNEAKNRRYDRRLARLAAFLGKVSGQSSRNTSGPSTSVKPKKPEKLSNITAFKGDTTDTKRFLTDVEVQFTYFKKSGLDDMDKIGLVVPLLENAAKNWYLGIHRYISEDEAMRMGIIFNPDNELRTWAGFRARLETSFGGHEDHDRNLVEWMRLSMKPGRVDKYLDKVVDLAASLEYTDSKQIIDKVRIGITSELRNAWALKQPHPTEAGAYIDLLRKVGHTLQDNANFGKTVAKDHGGSSNDKASDKGSSSKKQRKKEKGSGKSKSQPSQTNKTPKVGESAYAIAHKGIADNLTEKRRKSGQCSKCGQPGHFWRKCTSSSPVVHSAKGKNKRSANEAGLQEAQASKVKRIEAAPSSAGDKKLLEVRQASP